VKIWAAIVAAIVMLGIATPAFAMPRICATTYSAPVSELKGGWTALGIWRAEGAVHRKMSNTEWRECLCPHDGSACSCCEFDLAKMCAEVDRINTTTNSRFLVGACEGARS
jgi:hypothetical protein